MNKTTIAAALCAGLLAGCGEEEPAAPAAPPADPVVARMHDKEYVAKLEKQVDARKEIMREMAEAHRRLQEAEAAGKTGEELAACSNALRAAVKKFEMNRAESIVLVSQQMKKSAAAGNQELQQKGK